MCEHKDEIRFVRDLLEKCLWKIKKRVGESSGHDAGLTPEKEEKRKEVLVGKCQTEQSSEKASGQCLRESLRRRSPWGESCIGRNGHPVLVFLPYSIIGVEQPEGSLDLWAPSWIQRCGQEATSHLWSQEQLLLKGDLGSAPPGSPTVTIQEHTRLGTKFFSAWVMHRVGSRACSAPVKITPLLTSR